MTRYTTHLSYFLIVAIFAAALCVTAASWAEPKTKERLQAEELVTKGMDLSDGSKKEEEFYLEARKLDPSYHKVLLNLGLVYYDRRQYDVALTYLRQYVAAEPNALDGLYQLAATYDNLRRDDDALEHYLQYIQVAAEDQAQLTGDEQRYVQEAANAVRRLTTVPAPVNQTVTAAATPTAAPSEPATAVSREQQVTHILSENDNASVEEMIQILSRPRSRSVRFRLESAPVLALSGIHFEKASDEILPESFELLDRVGATLMDKRLASAAITIHGHASTEGDEQPNLALSERRAKVIKDYLVKEYNIPANRLEVRAWGEVDPLIAPDDSEAQRTANRRVEFERSGDLPAPGAPVVKVVTDESKPPQ